MTTLEKPKQIRHMSPTRISRALKPLREVLEEASKSKTLTKTVHDQTETCFQGLTNTLYIKKRRKRLAKK